MPDGPGPCVHPDVGAYALGLLEAEERHAYERHLITCAHCLRTLEGLAPLIELLGQVDAETLLAEAERGRVRRIAAHPPGASGTLFPRQRDPVRGRPRPHLRAWDELDDRFRTPARRAPRPEPVAPPARAPKAPRRPLDNSVVRRLVLVAAALTVVTMLSLVTIAARSSVTDPAATVAAPPRKEPGVAAAAGTTAAAPPGTASPATAPPAAAPTPPPPRSSTPARTTPPPARTGEATKPAPSATRPDSVKANPGGGPQGERLSGRDPATGAAAEVRLRRTATGLDVSVTVTGLPGPRDCVLRAITTDGAAQTALRWRIPAGQDSFTGLGGTTVDRAAISRFELIDATGTLLVTIG